MTRLLDRVNFWYLVAFAQICALSSAHLIPFGVTKTPDDNRPGRQISPDLFNSLNELAHIVDISYCIGTTGVQKPFQCLSHCRELEGFELLDTWHTGPLLSDSCGYIALSHPPSPKRIIVAFRGTYSIPNAIVDLTAIPQEYVPFSLGNDTDGDASKCTNCSVHLGFMNSWRSSRTTILDTIAAAKEQYPDYTLTLVGHSLGGAVAALAGTEMQLRGWDPVVTTFGEPRVGNKAFVEYLDTVFHLDSDDARDWKFRRVTHANDPVPLVPLEEWGYEMHSGEIYISRAELPFSVEDVRYCEGASDKECIAGAECVEATSSRITPGVGFLGPNAPQQVLSPPSSSSSEDQQEDKGAMGPDVRAESRTLWSLVPPRFRLWELFYSHRDYFIRLGLCLPGGDPSGKW
ncbi:Alpha/Beta hydrolase protein [Aspergillus unguis]